jgi:hypothetical protein
MVYRTEINISQFTSYKELVFQNNEININNVTDNLFNQIKKTINNEHILIYSSASAPGYISIRTEEKIDYILNKFLNSSFSKIEKKYEKTNFYTHYVYNIKITDLKKLIHIKNQETQYALMKKTNYISFIKNNKIKFNISQKENVENFLKNITRNNISIRFIENYDNGYCTQMQTDAGENVYVSEAILEDSFAEPIISGFAVNNNVIIIYLSPFFLEKINELSKRHYKKNIGFEIDGKVYGIFTIQKKRSVQREIPFMQSENKSKIKEMIKVLSSGPIYTLTNLENNEKQNGYMAYLLILIFLIFCLLMLALFFIGKRRKLSLLSYVGFNLVNGFFLYNYLGNSFYLIENIILCLFSTGIANFIYNLISQAHVSYLKILYIMGGYIFSTYAIFLLGMFFKFVFLEYYAWIFFITAVSMTIIYSVFLIFSNMRTNED